MSVRAHSPALATAAVVLLASFIGCAGEEASSPAASERTRTETETSEAAASAAPEPCSLLTADEIEAATGIAPGPGQDVAGACAWSAADGSIGNLVTLTVQHGDVTREQWLTIGDEEDIIEGVGDFAVQVGSQIQVFQNGWLVGVKVDRTVAPEARTELARSAHAKLAA
ncbi:MAG: hypothetical protein R2991_05775 [Thermoanaerobaculia bacterium]